MNPAEWRRFARQPGGIATILLLAVLLAFRIPACPMLGDADFTLPGASYGDCHQIAVKNAPTDANPLDCHDGPCLQALGGPGRTDLPPLLPSGLDMPALALMAEISPPDWSEKPRFSPAPTPAISPPPLQRSRILRL